MRTLAVLAGIGILGVPVPAFQNPGSVRLDAVQKRQAITELAKMLRARYAIAELAEKAALSVERKLAGGGYDQFTVADAFAQSITADLQDVTKDKHIRFGVAEPEPAPAPPAAAAQAERLLQVRRGNYGLVRAEILAGNVGYLEVRRFQPPDLSGDTIVAAMQFLANADALIVDVRNCRGGSPYTMPIFAGYLVSRPTHLFDMEFRGDNYTDHFWTSAWLPGKRLAEVPIYILTSGYTFSGAEGFAYRFKVLKRATIVGEVTGGGANAGGVLDVAPHFRVWMPMGRPVDRNTRTNWEGTGVEPDLRTSALEALETAHIEALKTLRAKSADDKDRGRLDRAVERAQAVYRPPEVTARDLERVAGAYSGGRVWVEGGQLRFQRETEAPYPLVPATRNVFMSDTNDPIRVEFLLGPGGGAERLVFTDEDGSVQQLARIK